jgi:hypothetical protein
MEGRQGMDHADGPGALGRQGLSPRGSRQEGAGQWSMRQQVHDQGENAEAHGELEREDRAAGSEGY